MPESEGQPLARHAWIRGGTGIRLHNVLCRQGLQQLGSFPIVRPSCGGTTRDSSESRAVREHRRAEAGRGHVMIRDMTPDQYLDGVAVRLRDAGVAVSEQEFGGTRAVVGYRSAFRARWVATRLHLFTIVVSEPEITVDGLGDFTEEALNFVIAKKGRFKGLQNGVAAIPVQISSNVSTGAAKAAESEIMRRFAAFAWPAVVDLSTGQVHSHVGRPAVGVVYASWMRQQTEIALQPFTP